ncbi:MAG: response regulator [Fuerstiella sp.]|jgi:CheY-like chemotaxis protein/anti-sigma regulatory factor (Ser/Thr protein kinase)
MVSILVVDDSATDRIRIAGLLKKQTDFTVELACDGVEALSRLEATGFDLVLTDLQMPNKDGLELVREMKSAYPHTPVILMTGRGSEEIAVQAMKDGAASYVNKASGSQWLIENIERVLAARVEARGNADLLGCLVSDEYELSLENDRTLMSATARFLSQAAQAAGLCPDSELPRLGVALEEALLNACLHGNLELDSVLREGDGTAFSELAKVRAAAAPWKDRRVTVKACITPQQLRVDIADEGSGFDASKIPDPTDPENLLKPHGRGVLMMRLFLDEVEWNDCGNRVTLIKNGQPQ